MSPTATATTVVLERRFNGPPGTANGGYACGIVARLLMSIGGRAHAETATIAPGRAH